jgi:hypothetical protein
MREPGHFTAPNCSLESFIKVHARTLASYFAVGPHDAGVRSLYMSPFFFQPRYFNLHAIANLCFGHKISQLLSNII